MTIDSLYSPLKWYDSLDEAREASGLNQEVYPKYSESRFINFQARVPFAGLTGFSGTIGLYDTNSVLQTSISTNQSFYTIDGFDYIIFDNKDGSTDLNLDCFCGYAVMEYNGSFYYSNFFCTEEQTDLDSDYVLIEWENSCGDLGKIIYSTGYENYMYLEGNIGLPVHEEIIVSSTDKDGLTVDESITIKKSLSFESSIVSDVTLDAIAFGVAHDSFKLDGDKALEVSVANTPQDKSRFYTLLVTVVTDVLQSTACCTNQLRPDCGASAPVITAVAHSVFGDTIISFNDDGATQGAPNPGSGGDTAPANYMLVLEADQGAGYEQLGTITAAEYESNGFTFNAGIQTFTHARVTAVSRECANLVSNIITL